MITSITLNHDDREPELLEIKPSEDDCDVYTWKIEKDDEELFSQIVKYNRNYYNQKIQKFLEIENPTEQDFNEIDNCMYVNVPVSIFLSEKHKKLKLKYELEKAERFRIAEEKKKAKAELLKKKREDKKIAEAKALLGLE